MNYKIIPTPLFKNQLKKLVKKYKSLKDEIIDLVEDLRVNPEQGIYLGNNCYKVRVSIKSKGKGKSGGARIITYFVTDEFELYFLTIYDKSDIDSISIKNIKSMIKAIKMNK